MIYSLPFEIDKRGSRLGYWWIDLQGAQEILAQGSKTFGSIIFQTPKTAQITLDLPQRLSWIFLQYVFSVLFRVL